MNILVTNDDEVTATGALTLAQAIIPLGNIKSWPQTIISPGTGMHIDALSNGFVSITPL
jgi:broad specificity polyphosphatase/5'/3'-nucleotidase SurE